MLVQDTPHSNWKNALKAHQPVEVGPGKRDETVYHLTALSKKVTPPSPTRNTGPAVRVIAYRDNSGDSSGAKRQPVERPYAQQIKDAGLAPKWAKTSAQGSFSAAVAKTEISSAAKALWVQYVALLSGRAVGPLPISVLNAVASYSSSQQAMTN